MLEWPFWSKIWIAFEIAAIGIHNYYTTLLVGICKKKTIELGPYIPYRLEELKAFNLTAISTIKDHVPPTKSLRKIRP